MLAASDDAIAQPTQKEINAAIKREKAAMKALQKSLPPPHEMKDVDPSVLYDIKVAMFDTRVADAQKMLQDHYQHNAWAMSIFCESGLVEFFIGEKKPEDESMAVGRMQMAITQAEQLVRVHKGKSQKRVEALCMEAHGFLSYGVFLVNTKSFVRAAYYVRKSWKRWNDANNMATELEAAGKPVSQQIRGFISFGMGFFYFGISMVPPQMEFVVKLLGFRGNRPLACEMLELSAATPQCGKSIESSLILYTMKFWLLDEREAAVALLLDLKKRLPKSPLICMMHGWQCMIMDRDTDKALENYREGRELAHIKQLKLAFMQQEAWAYYLREDWDLLVSTATEYLELTKTRDSGSYSSFSLGLAHHMLGQEEKCTASMRRCIEIAEKQNNNWDSYAVHNAKAYIANNCQFDRCALLFVLAENACDAGRPEKALTYLDEIEGLSWKGFTDDDKCAMHAYFKGCALRIQKNFDQAKSWLIKCAGFHTRTISYGAARAVPYALVVLGEMAMRDLDPPQLGAAGRFFAKAKSFDKKFQFHELLSFRLKSDLEVLDAKRTKEEQAE